MTKQKTEFLVGTSGWNYPDWRGVFYPKELPQKDWLKYYATQFSTVEINATFYRFFKEENYIKWRDAVPTGFRYVLKTPRLITHQKYLYNCEDSIKYFCHLVSLLKSKFALTLLQIPPHMRYDPELLRNAILTFDHPKKVVVEFRHKKWLNPEIKTLLSDIGCVFCSADSPNMKLLDWVTSDIAYIRLHGRKEWFDYNYSKRELNGIAKMAKQMSDNGAKKVYVFFNNDYEAYSVNNALYLQKLLG